MPVYMKHRAIILAIYIMANTLSVFAYDYSATAPSEQILLLLATSVPFL